MRRIEDKLKRTVACIMPVMLILFSLLLAACSKEPVDDASAKSGESSSGSEETSDIDPAEVPEVKLSARSDCELVSRGGKTIYGSCWLMDQKNFESFSISRQEDEDGSWLYLSGMTDADSGSVRFDGTVYFGPPELFADLDPEEGGSPEELLLGRLLAIDENAVLSSESGTSPEWSYGAASGNDNGKEHFAASAYAVPSEGNIIVLMLDVTPDSASAADAQETVKIMGESLNEWAGSLSVNDSGADFTAAQPVLWLANEAGMVNGADTDLFSLSDLNINMIHVNDDEGILTVSGMADISGTLVDINGELRINKEAIRSAEPIQWEFTDSVEDGVLFLSADGSGASAYLEAVLSCEDAAEEDYSPLIKAVKDFLSGCTFQ